MAEPAKRLQASAKDVVASGEGGWRLALANHATSRWKAVLAAMANGQAIPSRNEDALRPQIAALGTQANEAIKIIDRFAMGAAAESFSDGIFDGEPGEDFRKQIERIIAGLAPERETSSRLGSMAASQGRPPVFQSELWQILHKVRESAELSYAREIDLVELDRRTLLLLRAKGPLVPAGLAAAIGVDKAQVSRSVKRLLDLGLLIRDQIRSPIALTAKGQEIADRLMRLAELRNRELGFDIADSELSEFFAVMEVLLDRAVSLYEDERDMASRGGRADRDPEPGHGFEPRRTGEPIAIDRSRIVSPLLTLSAYLSRSGALAFKRLTGLSNFEAWVLSEISFDPPTDWSRLVKALERDHSQAGRTVNHLVARGIVTREGKPGRRHGRFSPTEEGARLYEIIVRTSEKRNDYLMEPIPQDRQHAFLATFEKIRRNSAAQLERERAMEEIDAGRG